MKVDFLTRFKGRTSMMNKSEGITGIIKAHGSPIEKIPASETCCTFLAKTASHTILDSEKPYEYQNSTETNPQIITNINHFNNRKLSQSTPINQMKNITKSQLEPNKSSTQTFPLSKTGQSHFNLNDYEFVAIPRDLLYRIKIGNTEGDLLPPKEGYCKAPISKSQTFETLNSKPLIKSQILSQGSYAKQNERKRSLLQAGLNAIQC